MHNISGGKEVYERFKLTSVSYEIVKIHTNQRRMRFRAQVTDIGHIHSFTSRLCHVDFVLKLLLLLFKSDPRLVFLPCTGDFPTLLYSQPHTYDSHPR